jgi:hypothetical protein
MRRCLIAFLPLCLGCGSSSPTPEAPPSPPTATAASEPSPPPPAEPPPTATAAAAASGTAAAGANKGSAEPPKKADCPTLKKDLCKVTNGCAWSEGAGVKSQCVSEGTK